MQPVAFTVKYGQGLFIHMIILTFMLFDEFTLNKEEIFDFEGDLTGFTGGRFCAIMGLQRQKSGKKWIRLWISAPVKKTKVAYFLC